jgi:hypothetical protein
MVLKKHNIYRVSEDIHQYNYCNVNIHVINVFVGHNIDMMIYDAIAINKGFMDIMHELRWDTIDIV